MQLLSGFGFHSLTYDQSTQKFYTVANGEGGPQLFEFILENPSSQTPVGSLAESNYVAVRGLVAFDGSLYAIANDVAGQYLIDITVGSWTVTELGPLSSPFGGTFEGLAIYEADGSM